MEFYKSELFFPFRIISAQRVVWAEIGFGYSEMGKFRHKNEPEGHIPAHSPESYTLPVMRPYAISLI
jgi:hypothetical protein